MSGARVESTLGWIGVEFDTPESHDFMAADLAVLCTREHLSQNSGFPHDGMACRTRLKTRIGKTRENLSYLLFFVKADFALS